MATTALVLGCFLVGAAPAARADHDERGAFRGERDPLDERSSFHGERDPLDERGAFHGAQDSFRSAHRGDAFRNDAYQVRALAFELERATDELVHDARRAAGRLDRRDVAALRAARQLESAADEFRREVARGRVLDRDARRDFARLQRSYREAIHELDAFRFARDLRLALRRVDRLLVTLDQALDEHHRQVAWRAGRPARVAWR
jgi:hypothetical protein